MSDPINFDELQVSSRKPGAFFELQTKNAVRGLPGNLQHMVIVAQRLAAGTVAEATPTKVYSAEEAATYAGRGSAAHLMVKQAIKTNRYVDLTISLLDDAGAGAAAVKTVTITGPATGPGEFVLKIGNQRIAIAIATDDVQNAIGTALNTEIAKYPDMLYTAAVADNVITLTCRHAGTVGNQVDVSTEITAAGVSAVVATTTPGATDPDIQTALDEMEGETYEIYTTHLNDATSAAALKTHIDTVSNGVSMRAGRVVLGMDDSIANAVTIADGLNAGRVAVALCRNTNSPAYELAAACASKECAPKYEDPAIPRKNMPMTGIHAPEVASRFSDTEIETMLASGVTPVTVDASGQVQILRFISTYTQNADGVADDILLDFNTLAEMDYGRRAILTEVSTRFNDAKNTARTRANLRSVVYATMIKLEDAEIWQNVEENKDGLVVIEDPDVSSRARIRIPSDVVKGLHQIYGVIDLVA